MSYVPLHHKYRPQTFAQLVGQGAIATTLSSALNRSQIAPAYLFTGARGTGKTSSARIFAKSLNCMAGDRPTPEPCGTCETCVAITKGNALDVIEIDAASNTGVDNIRELIDRAQFAPVQCRYKVYVIDECLTGDTLVLTQDGWQRIDDSAINGKQVLSYNETSRQWEWKQVKRWLVRGKKQTYVVKTNQREIRCTTNHLIRTVQGWQKTQNLKVGDRILSPANAVAENLSSNMAAIAESGDLCVGTNSKAISSDVKSTTWQKFWRRQTPSVHTACAAVAKSWEFPNTYSKREWVYWGFNPTGNTIHTSKPTVFGSSALKLTRQDWDSSPMWNVASSMALYWEIPRSHIPIPTVDFLALPGPMGNLSNYGWNIKPIDYLYSNLRSAQQRIKDTVKCLLLDIQPATLGLKRFTEWLNLIIIVSKSLVSGWSKLLQKAWLGGTWMTDRYLTLPQAPQAFKCIPKVSRQLKTNFWQNGLQKWATLQNGLATDEPVATRSSTIYQWAQKPQEIGLPTYNNIQSQVWNTSLEVVEAVEMGAVEPVYDIEVEDNHNFVANGLLVHNCHMLTGAAFNALLKTLEEPPNRVVFVLATTDPQRVLPTIISRCQRFDFRRIPLDDMVSHLTMIAQQESINITPNALQLVGQIAQGGLRDAESLLDQLGLMAEEVDAEQVWDLVGAVPERDLLSLVRSIAADDAEGAIDLTRRLMDRGREPLIVLQNLASFYRDLLIARTAPNRPDLVAITPGTWEQMCELVKSLPGKLLLSSQQHLRSAELQIKNTTQPRLWLEVTLLGLLPSAIAPGTEVVNTQAQQAIAKAPVTTVVSTVVSPPPAPAKTPVPAVIAAQPIATPTPVNQPIETPPETPPETSSETSIQTPAAATLITDGAELQHLWQQVLGEIELASTRGIVSASCYLLELNGNALKIAVRSKGMLPTVKTKAQALGKAATKTLRQSVKISLVVVEGGEPARSPTVPPNPIQPKPLAENAPTPTPEKKPARKGVVGASPPPKAEIAPPPIAPPPEATPPVIPPVTAWTPDDPLNRAAKSLAQAFAGSIVDVDDRPAGDGAADAIEEIEDTNDANDNSDTDAPDSKTKFRNVPF